VIVLVGVFVIVVDGVSVTELVGVVVTDVGVIDGVGVGVIGIGVFDGVAGGCGNEGFSGFNIGSSDGLSSTENPGLLRLFKKNLFCCILPILFFN
jgi:hypothetical protein